MSDRTVSEFAPELPRRFGRYTLLKSMAKGGMGEVFLAKTEGVAGIQKLCVLKTLRAHLRSEPHVLQRFLDEARVVVQLSHKNICQVFDVGEVGGQFYMAMELIHGRDLRAILSASREVTGGIGADLAVFIAIEMLEGLDYAHRFTDPMTGKSLNLVHRDVSPHNLMVSQEGEVKLIDFGIAASTVKEIRTMPNIIVGKLAYMAPEQALGDPRVDHRADQFAAAIVLYEATVCERFYPTTKFTELLAMVENSSYRPPAFERLPKDLRDVLDVALQPEPDKRFASCGAFRDALNDFQKKRGEHKHERDLRKLVDKLFSSELTAFREEIARVASSDSSPSMPAAPRDPNAETRVVTMEVEGVHGEDNTSQTAERMAPTSPVQNDTASFIGTSEELVPRKSRSAGVMFVLAAIATMIVGAVIVVSTSTPTEEPLTRDAGPATISLGSERDAGPAVIALGSERDAGPAVMALGGDRDAGTATLVVDAGQSALVVDAGAVAVVVDAGQSDPVDAGAVSDSPDAGAVDEAPDAGQPQAVQPRRITAARLKTLDTVQKLAILKRACPRSPCAKRVLARSERIGTLSVEELVAFKNDLDACVLRCP